MLYGLTYIVYTFFTLKILQLKHVYMTLYRVKIIFYPYSENTENNSFVDVININYF